MDHSFNGKKRLIVDVNVRHYRNNDAIIHAETPKQFETLGGEETGAFIITPEGNYLYNWYSIIDKRCIAPKGFHIPNEKEFHDLEEQLIDKATFAGLVYGGGFTGYEGSVYYWSFSTSVCSNAWIRNYDKSKGLVIKTADMHKVFGFSICFLSD